MAEQIWNGTEVKMRLTIEAPGFSMDNDDFTIVLKCGGHSLTFTKDDLVVDEHGNYIVCFDTAPFGSGSVDAVITAYVPDDDFNDGTRTEVLKLTNIGRICEV